MDLENHPMLMGIKRDSVTAQHAYLGLFSLETLDLDPCNLSSLKGWFKNRRDIFFFFPQGNTENRYPVSGGQKLCISGEKQLLKYGYYGKTNTHTQVSLSETTIMKSRKIKTENISVGQG